MRHSFTTVTLLGTVVLLAFVQSAAGQEFSISPVWIDLSPGEGIPPGGFDGQFNAGSVGFDSYPDVPGFSDASVLFVPEPSALCLLALGSLLLMRR